MSRFLRVGLISDKIDDIIEASRMLQEEVDPKDRRVWELARDIADMATDLKKFMASFHCEPLIYTGRGTTDEVISLLDSLLSKAENELQAPTGRV